MAEKRLSWSAYKDYAMDCPKKYRYRYIDKTPVKAKKFNSLGGSTVQRVFELFYKDSLWAAKDKTTELLQELLARELDLISKKEKIDWNDPEIPMSQEELLNTLKPTIPLILNLIKSEKFFGEEIDTEKPFSLDMGGFLVNGNVDFIFKRDGKVTLLDGKLTVHRDKYLKTDQLVYYCLLYQDATGKIPDRVGWIYYTYGEVKWVKVRDQDIKDLRSKILKAIEGIKAEKFEPTPTYIGCKFCDYQSICTERYGKKVVPAEVQAIFDSGDKYISF